MFFPICPPVLSISSTALSHFSAIFHDESHVWSVIPVAGVCFCKVAVARPTEAEDQLLLSGTWRRIFWDAMGIHGIWGKNHGKMEVKWQISLHRHQVVRSVTKPCNVGPPFTIAKLVYNSNNYGL
jgi:hypothetical protein